MQKIQPEIDFKTIRPIRDSRRTGFEEFIVQVFRRDVDPQIEFRRIEGSGGDGGIEAFTLTRSSKIGLQAKFFDQLGNNQWKQISDSVETAIKNHSDLTEYRIVVPLDRTPAQQREWDSNLMAGIGSHPQLGPMKG